jgi:alanine-glyoxylate transaminase/serine-glyoxylate transaminase/serine-pyruvate transaminase
VLGCVAIELHCGGLKLQPFGTFAGVELSLHDVGYPVTLGSGVAATQAHLQRSTQPIASRI